VGENSARATTQTDDADTDSDSAEERESSEVETQTAGSAETTTVARSVSIQRSSSAGAGTPSGGTGGVRVERPSPGPGSLSERYDLNVGRREAGKLQRLEDEFGVQRVSEWADEGMTVETMGKPRDMQAFRQRQADRSAEIPTDIERRNQASAQRNTAKNHEDGPAGDTGVPDSVRNVISSSGRSLDPAIQREMADKMGDDFSDVQVHTGPEAAKAAEEINARAFTVGNHVVFNHGEYDPSSAEGQHTIAHELAHVRQQTGGAVSMLPKEEVQMEIDPDPGLEQEAEATAQRVMRGGELGVQRMADTDVHVQRLLDGLRGSAGEETRGNESNAEYRDVGGESRLSDRVYALAENQERLKQNQQQVMKTLTEVKPGAPTDGEFGEAATKGVLGSLAGAGAGAAIGGAAGSIVPGVGTVAGAALGAAVSGATGDVAKEGVEFMSENRPGGEGEEVQTMYNEMRAMYRELKEGEETDEGESQAGSLGR